MLYFSASKSHTRIWIYKRLSINITFPQYWSALSATGSSRNNQFFVGGLFLIFSVYKHLYQTLNIIPFIQDNKVTFTVDSRTISSGLYYISFIFASFLSQYLTSWFRRRCSRIICFEVFCDLKWWLGFFSLDNSEELQSLFLCFKFIEIVIDIKVTNRGKGYWKLNNSLLNDHMYQKLINEIIHNYVLESQNNLQNARTIWDLCKIEIKEQSIKYGIIKTKQHKNHLKELEDELSKTSILKVLLKQYMSPTGPNKYLRGITPTKTDKLKLYLF